MAEKIMMEQQLNSLADTQQLAGAILPLVNNHKGNTPFIVFLDGNLGAGKTTFCQYFIRQIYGNQTLVNSPTFSLIELHQAHDLLSICHMDLYRLESPEEIEHLGLDDYYEANTLWLIEWSEKAIEYLPRPNLRIEFCLSYDREQLQRLAKVWG